MYQYLNINQQIEIISAIRASRPTPEQIILNAEIDHWRSKVNASIGLNDEPDDFTPPDTTQAAIEHQALDELENSLWQ